MNKIYLIIYNRENKTRFIKYFETEFEKDKFKRKLYYSKKLFVIEDSCDICYNN